MEQIERRDPLEVADAILDLMHQKSRQQRVIGSTDVRHWVGTLRACIAVERRRREEAR